MPRQFLMLDLCAGLGGASQAMLDRGWKVIRVDIEPSFKPDIVADVRHWSYRGPKPLLIWASPPCKEFSRHFLPWLKAEREPDMSVVLACKRIIEEVQPVFWVIENVRGAVPFFEPVLGKPAQVIFPYYLWGRFPPLSVDRSRFVPKQRFSSRDAAKRAWIPYELSYKLALACEAAVQLL